MPVQCFKFFLTLYLIIFLIGGGRLCACEALSWAGIDVHGDHDSCHHHDHDGHHDHDEDVVVLEIGVAEHPLHDCCEKSLQPIEGILPKALSFSNGTLLIVMAMAPTMECDFQVPVSEGFASAWKHPPPRASSQRLRLAIFQSYLI